MLFDVIRKIYIILDARARFYERIKMMSHT